MPRSKFLPCLLFRLGSMIKHGEPILTDPDVEEAAKELPIIIAVLGGISRVFNTTFWRQVLCESDIFMNFKHSKSILRIPIFSIPDDEAQVYQLFEDPEYFKLFLTEESEILNEVEATLFMNSTIAVSGILDQIQGGKRQGTCEDKIRAMFVTDDARSVGQFAAVACHLSAEEWDDLVEILHLNTDVQGILDQANFVVDHAANYSLWNILDDVSRFERMIIDLESIGGHVPFFDANPIFYLDLWIPELTDCIESLADEEADQGDWAV